MKKTLIIFLNLNCKKKNDRTKNYTYAAKNLWDET
jgi:hypothetical protein